MLNDSDRDELLSEFDGSELHRPFANRISEVIEPAHGETPARIDRKALEKLEGELGSIVSGIRSMQEARSLLFTMISIVAGYELAGAHEIAKALRELLDKLSGHMARMGQDVEKQNPGQTFARFEGNKGPALSNDETPPEGSTKAGPLARFALRDDRED